MRKNIKYEEAMQELELIVQQVENGTLDMDVILAKIKRAQELIGFCKEKLTKTEAEISHVLKRGEDTEH